MSRPTKPRAPQNHRMRSSVYKNKADEWYWRASIAKTASFRLKAMRNYRYFINKYYTKRAYERNLRKYNSWKKATQKAQKNIRNFVKSHDRAGKNIASGNIKGAQKQIKKRNNYAKAAHKNNELAKKLSGANKKKTNNKIKIPLTGISIPINGKRISVKGPGIELWTKADGAVSVGSGIKPTTNLTSVIGKHSASVNIFKGEASYSHTNDGYKQTTSASLGGWNFSGNIKYSNSVSSKISHQGKMVNVSHGLDIDIDKEKAGPVAAVLASLGLLAYGVWHAYSTGDTTILERGYQSLRNST